MTSGDAIRSYPLTADQRRLWFLQQLSRRDASYNMYMGRRWHGPLSLPALSAALNRLVARHEVLRTRFDLVDEQPLQLVDPPYQPVVELVELAVEPGAGAREIDRRITEAVAERINAPFDLATGPLLRPTVFRVGPDDHAFSMGIHHIVSDGWSAGLMWAELLTLYRAELGEDVAEPPAPELQFGEFAVAEEKRLSGPAGESDFVYWSEKLAGLPPLLLPTDRPRPKRPAHEGEFSLAVLDAELTSGVERLAREQRCTPFMVLLAAYQILLSRWSGQQDFGVGTPVAGRNEVEYESMLGYFSKTVVIRADLEGDPDFRTVLRRVRSAVMGAFGHQDVPLERLMNALGIARERNRPPLFQTLFVLQSQDQMGGKGEGGTPDGVVLGQLDAGYAQAKFDVLLDVWRDGEELVASFCFDRALFDRRTVEAVAEQYRSLLATVVADPLTPVRGDWLVGAEERERLLALGSGPELPERVATVLERFATSVAAQPDAVALEFDGETLSYAELDRRSALLAERLGERAGQVLAVRIDPSFELVTALLAVWKAGAAYLPLDASYPAERLRLMLRDSAATLLLSTSEDGELDVPVLLVPRGRPEGEPAVPPAVDPSAPAYLLYTSGSTGRPKGVLVDHAALAARVHWMAGDGYRLRETDRVAQFASIGFDTHAEEIWPALSAGARCVLLPGGGRTLPDFLRTSAGAELTVLDLPTAYWHELVDLGEAVSWPAALRLVILGGSEARAQSVAAWRVRHGDRVRLVNTYGPTEATVIATSAELGAADTEGRPPLGRPLPGVRAYVLDERQRLLPAGAVGELALGGAGLAIGYLGRPELTADQFGSDPFARPGTRMYRTGDRARWRSDGQLEFLGRSDDQVKIRGYRIELAEIETALTDHPAVARAAALVGDGGRLLAYVVPRAGVDARPPELRDHLADRLPAFMVPAGIALVGTLPLTPNGKLDLAALPRIDPAARLVRAYLAPRTDAETLIAELWQEVLGVEKAGALDDFFELGGDSLLVTRVAARIRSTAGLDVQVRDVFENPTLASLAALVEELLIAEIDALSEDEVESRLD
ncbi:amino acid adenylation domain-containing protein [Kitasatospora sp. NBC_01287]|uniref:non-ribosomal peptide synthetase n=1 Tax=Kitasatospora sp. NBC_01287 TaxID=2903573 RepID=UPI00224F06F4|nr:amino acid adenylation domain-containing protein [Kitasatospora sp. NBC_01287]MCX4750208.1 amino acid adenylation domain-containing protein [Kitasatospora sp. NBC_01287]